MADERMRFVLEGRDNLSRAMNRAGDNARRLKSDLESVSKLAALPAAAAGAGAALSLAAAVGAAAAAVAAFSVAVAPQARAIGKVVEAQEAWTDAVKESGRGSEEAAKAQLAYSRSVEDLPRATRESAAALVALKEAYKEWSDSVADDTMPVLTKSFELFAATLPKLTPLVRGTSTELDRLMNVVAGMSASPAFDNLIRQFTEFSSGILFRATTELANLSRTLRSLDTSTLDKFAEIAEEHGPLVVETLKNVTLALANILAASSGVGVAVLKVANALAQVVNAIPPEALATLIQFYTTLRLVGTASALVATGAAAASARLMVMSRALAVVAIEATTAGGAMAGLRAGFAALSTTARAGLIAGAIIGIALAVQHLADESRGAPPDVDRLTTSLKKLAISGEFVGELDKTFGNLDGLGKRFTRLTQDAKAFKAAEDALGPTLTKSIRKFHDLADSFVHGEESAKAAREDFKGLDESLAGMVKSGHADTAAAAFDQFATALRKQGRSVKDVKAALPEYAAALEAAKVAQNLAAEGMGIFGDRALKTARKLDEQKASADGLRQAIIALNDTNRDAYDAQIAFEKGLDSLTAAFKENGATLDINTAAGQRNGAAMSSAAKAHDEMLVAGIAAGDSLVSMTRKSSQLREEMLRLAKSTNMSDKEAREYVNTLLGTPEDIKTLVKLERKDALKGLKDVQRQIDKTPGKKRIRVDTLNAAAIAALEEVGLKTRRLKDGRTEVFTKNGQSLGAIGDVRRAMNRLDGKTASTFIKTFYTSIYDTVRRDQSFDLRNGPRKAQGGLIRAYAAGGAVQGFPTGGFVSGPGTATSDSIPARLSDGEFVIRAAAVRRYGVSLMNALNDMRMPAASTLPTGTSQAANVAAPPASSTTFNVYPQRADFTVHDLEALQRRADTRNRVGRAR